VCTLPVDGVLGGGAGAESRGLHSSTVRLNFNAFRGIMVHVGVVAGVFRRCQGMPGGI